MRRAGIKQQWATFGLVAGWLVVGLGLTACSGGTNDYNPYSSQPYGGDDAAGDEGETEADTDYPDVDLDDGGPPPPPGGDDGGVPADNHGECCVGNGTPGCDNKPVELCVCASDSWCCESEWDQACAALIEQLGCGHCTEGDDPPPPPGGDDGGVAGGDCCAAHGTPGCDDAAVEACVCDVDPQCCDAQWSAGCTAILDLYDCGSCGGDPPPAGDTGGDPPPPGGETGGGDPPPGGTGDCCANNGSPGCDDAGIETCVCNQDAYCCDTEWDGVCVNEVDSFGCGTCGGGGSDGGGGSGGGGGPSACCEQQPGAGCPDAAVQACVCATDDYCCNVLWDLTCVGEVESLGCGTCS